MSKFSSEDRSGSPFQHPITEEWLREWENIAQIYAGRTAGTGEMEVFKEYCVRGDSVGYPENELNLLFGSGSYKPMVWSMRLSSSTKDWCVVFAPPGFDVQMFRHDLMLLYMLGTFGNLCSRNAHLEKWETPAVLLAGDRVWGDVQGWWHKKHGVIVVALKRDNAQLLFEHAMKSLGLKDDPVTELDDGYALIDRVFREASEIFLEEAARTPRT